MRRRTSMPAPGSTPTRRASTACSRRASSPRMGRRSCRSAGGAAGGVGALAGGVDVGTIRNDVSALVAGGADVRAEGNVEVNAHSARDVDSFAIGGAGGLVGLNASVSVWSLGDRFSPNYSTSSEAGEAGSNPNALQG